MAPAIFLPGILMPARLRYAPLRQALAPAEDLFTKELEIYVGPEPPPGYTIATETGGLGRFADDRGLDRFHLYGHSAGGAIALAYAAEHPDRVLSLALDEPGTDFNADDREQVAEIYDDELAGLPASELMARFARTLVREEVVLPAPPDTPPDAEMAKRPAGVVAFLEAMQKTRIDLSALAEAGTPVYYSYGSLSHPRWEQMAERLQRLLPNTTVERYEGLHHLNTSHAAEPERVADALRRLWGG